MSCFSTSIIERPRHFYALNTPKPKTSSTPKIPKSPLIPPDIAIVDGNGPLERVIRSLWPDTALQRCYFHIRQRLHTPLTRHPRTQPGRELLALVKTLNQLRTAEQVAAFTAEFVSWTSRWDAVLKRTDLRQPAAC